MIFKLVLFAIALSLILVVLSDSFKSGAVVLSVGGCVVLFAVFVRVFSVMKSNSVPTFEGADKDAIAVILKTLAVAYLTGFGSDICTDAGQRAVANALETAGKAIMLSMALPMLLGIFDSVNKILGG